MNAKIFLISVLSILLPACSASLPKINNITRYPRVGYDDLIEGERTIYGKIKFEPIESGVGRSVTVSTLSGHKEAARWEESIDPDIKIDAAKNYKIDLLSVIFEDRGYNDEVLRVFDDDHLIFDASVCYMHKTKMRRVIENEVALEDYGPYMKQYFKGHNFTPRLFPNDGKAYLGCGVGPEFITWKCQKCFDMSEKWKRQHDIE